MTELLPADEAALARLAPTIERARAFVAQGQAANTARAYAADWAHFSAWCADHGLAALPAAPATVALYLTDLAEPSEAGQAPRKVSTIQRRLSGIVSHHRAADHPSPAESREVRAVMRGIRRSKGTRQVGKAPLMVNDLRALMLVLPHSPSGIRDRALLLLGFAGAFRRSELVALNVDDLEFSSAGLAITLRRAKTDQEGRSRRIGIPYGSSEKSCPVRSLQAWLESARIHDGPVFRSLDRFQRVQPRRLSDKAVARIIKRRAKAVGLDPERYAGHSLRSGLATSAAAGGASERAIMAQTGHRSTDMVRRYIREANLFAADNAASLAGL